jgi:DNA-directed RNA polymerase specialized sigma24 family protein
VSADVSDGDLARLARGGDPVAFRLLVERHQVMVRARARQLGPGPGEVDDIVQESFLQATGSGCAPTSPSTDPTSLPPPGGPTGCARPGRM